MAKRAVATIIQTQASIRELVEKAFRLISEGDFTGYFDLFTEDAVWMLPSDFEDVNRAKARSFYGFTDKFRFDQQMTIHEVGASGDLGFARISMDGFLRPKDDPVGAPLRSASRHIWLFARQPSGEWKITRDIWNNPRRPQG